MSTHIDLPEAAHSDVDSMLSRKFGREVANYFSGSALNRVSFLRGDNKFLSAALTHPTTSFLLLKELSPVAHSQTKLFFSSYTDLKPLLDPNPYSKTEDDLIASFNSSTIPPQLIFLGLDESNPTADSFSWTTFIGAPYFALDISPIGPHAEHATKILASYTSPLTGLTVLEGRLHMTLSANEAAIYAQSRSLMDWNSRSPFCASCGQKTMSIHGGWKRACPTVDLAFSSDTGSRVERPACATRKGISNICFPRTDPTIIVSVLNPSGTALLLGRQARWPPYWYSTLAGFIEPGESIEEAVRREVWEESGVRIGRVVVHSSQPWPYPASLMIGCVAQAIEGGDKVDLGNDAELEDAKWFAIDQVRDALKNRTGNLADMNNPVETAKYKEGDLRLPPKTAIANRLIEAVVNDGFLGGEFKL